MFCFHANHMTATLRFSVIIENKVDLSDDVVARWTGLNVQ